MSFIHLLKTSFKVLRANRRRYFLTILGIIIGVAAVIIVMSVGAGAQSLIFDQITSVGSNLIGVLPGYSDENGPPATAFGITVTTLKQEDAEALAKIKGMEAVTSYVRGLETMQWQDKKTEATYVGVSADYPQVESAETSQGSFFTEEDNKAIARVVVLGWQVSKDLFGDENPLNQQVKIKRESFRVIGVMEKRGVEAFENQDGLVFIPLLTAQKIMLGINHVSLIRGKVKNERDVPAAITQVEQILRERHKIQNGKSDDFTVRAAVEALDALKTVTDALKFFLSAIAAISLLVGGIGIMNIMLVTVSERTREIGLRKALGATKKDIERQFLLEALVLTIAGGIIGIIGGAVVSGLVAVVARYLGYNWSLVVTFNSIAMGVIISGLVGVIFGWYPARRAASFDPVVALRYE
ncbi:multidrug ABC transporter substrate-binding protein [Candidatus Falkowbacteria bacterium CG10_big_fil_rev_8_21_14_0_10_43_10]|uniref:Multidrug ABC transporter substrate-binding protein n=1 Tax=Candidatus Falkowbacteria bacterium CG10_big_fil_rev_8_21_14_0_10_43_10 TaxID=1974567 RepID=A0A2H0V3E7_9BACT|nr:MAG: multidrug ABC transporter substrate-binding protein [Candidatus Falkowbacteria bacterium CG10_big_fil_rev_8_21_14_0_10_43_10]